MNTSLLFAPPRALALTLALVALASSPALAGSRYGTVGRAGVTVYYAQGYEGMARDALELYPLVVRETGARLGLDASFAHDVVLVGNHGEFIETSGSGGIIAFARAGERAMYLDASEVLRRGGLQLEGTLRHELCHLALGRAMGAGPLPLWFNEGVCQWASGGITELPEEGRTRNLTAAALFGGLIPLARLDDRFPAGGQAQGLAYAQALSAVTYLNSAHGEGAARGIIARLVAGDSMEAAIAGVTGTGLAEFEKGWRGSLLGPMGWLTFVGANLYELLFLMAAVALVAGFLRVRYRLRRHRDEDDPRDEDGPWRHARPHEPAPDDEGADPFDGDDDRP